MGKWIGLIHCIALCVLCDCSVLFCASLTQPNILILNSYHKGYSWSDDVLSGIESSIYHQFPEAQISIEYLDTKRNSSVEYMTKVEALYEEKFRPGMFDLVIATDDNGINFALQKREQLFGDIPLVFCGANNMDPAFIKEKAKVTGVLEHSDIKGTIELALTLRPNTDKIFVVNDRTVTGEKVGETLATVVSKFSKDIELHFLEDLPLAELENEVKGISGDSIILLLAYLRDKNGTYYAPQHTARILSEASQVPIFSVWDFFFNYGILGGVLTFGHLHGEAAGEMAVQILQGKTPGNIPIIANGGNRLVIDYRQLKRFSLDEKEIPREAIVKNVTYQNQKNVFVLLSYSLASKWNTSVLQGIQEQFFESGQDIKVSVEFMDTKRFSDKAYLAKLTALYRLKYKQQDFDAVIVSDDNAYQFVLRHRELLTGDAPLVFCGVNYLENPQLISQQNITGIVESYDILGTIRLGLKLFPGTEKIYVINDQSTSGKANEMKLQEALTEVPKQLKIEKCGLVSMQELLKKVSALEPNTLVLLMSFTMDRHNQRFTYENSVKIIHQKANRPIFGFWDFYLGEGIVGGVVTSGLDQGRVAASMALDIMSGKQVADIPVLQASPVQSTIDFMYLSNFKWDEKELPKSYRVLNRPDSFFESYRKLVYVTLTILAVLFILILTQAFKILLQKKEKQHLTEQAVTDDLTGAKSRNYFLTYLEQQMRVCKEYHTTLSICYFDIDNLKVVNDTYGHIEGDNYILYVISAIRKFIRKDDVLSRVGGDEFVATLAGRSMEKTTSFVANINVELAECRNRNQLHYDLGVSCGFATFDAESDLTAQDLIEIADRQMYNNKQKKKRFQVSSDKS